MTRKPLAIDLYAGLGGWTDGLLAEGWDVIGFDIEAHHYGDERYPAQLVVQDVLTLHGRQFKDADLIVGSSPCQEYSYMAMPWSRAKAKAEAIRADETGEALRKLNALFDAQFRIQREACEAAGRHIPMVVENVRGAIPWVGRSAWNYGSYHLWGDIPALMPIVVNDAQKFNPDGTAHPKGSWFAVADSKDRGSSARKNPGFRFGGQDGAPSASFQTTSVERHLEGVKVPAIGGGRRTDPGKGARFTSRDCGQEGAALKSPARVSALPPAEGRKGAGAGAAWFDQNISSLPSSSPRRKAASAKIAKIPFALSTHIARVYRPRAGERRHG